ncbi:MAG: hypothetical protein V4547_19000 [Bacteroidota bacterium]
MFFPKSFIFLFIKLILFYTINLNYVFSNDEEINIIPGFKTLQSTLTDAAMVALGKADHAFSNVGRLSEVYELPFGQKITLNIGSAVLLDKREGSCTRTCLSAAHCVEKPTSRSAKMQKLDHYLNLLIPRYYQVTFESNDEPSYSCIVTKYVVHPEYLAGNNGADIAILRLNKTVPHLPGLAPCYTFLSEFKKIVNSNKSQFYDPRLRALIYVGYGRAGTDSDYLKSRPDGKRRASLSLLHYFQTDSGNALISIPFKTQCRFDEFNLVDLTQQREPMPFEIGRRVGMSGGATISPLFGLVGINRSAYHSDISPIDRLKLEKKQFIKKWDNPICIGLFLSFLHATSHNRRPYGYITKFSLGLFYLFALSDEILRNNDMYVGTRCTSTAIDIHEEWIKKHREEFEKEG